MFAALALLLAVVGFRIASGALGHNDFQWLHNFAPLSAVALCSAGWLPRRWALWLPLGMLLVSDVVLNLWIYHVPLLTVEMAPRYFALALISLLGLAMRGRARLAPMLAASVVSSLIFYVLTNSASWLAEPRYARSVAGWVQALSSGLPDYTSTWSFYRCTLLSDLAFTALFAACLAVQAAPARAAVEAEVCGSRP